MVLLMLASFGKSSALAPPAWPRQSLDSWKLLQPTSLFKIGSVSRCVEFRSPFRYLSVPFWLKTQRWLEKAGWKDEMFGISRGPDMRLPEVKAAAKRILTGYLAFGGGAE